MSIIAPGQGDYPLNRNAQRGEGRRKQEILEMRQTFARVVIVAPPAGNKTRKR